MAVAALAVDAVDPAIVYAGTRDQGVFVSVDGGASWVPSNSGLYNLSIGALAVEADRVYAGSGGNGTFVMPLGATTTTTSTSTTTTTSLQQAILGRRLIVKDPKLDDPSKRKIVVVATELGSEDTLDPATVAANGAMVTISADGASPSSQAFSMPPPWKAVGTTGAKYVDKAGVHGPVKLALLNRTSSGKFKLKVVVLGKLGPVQVVPPNPGTGASVVVQVGGGAEYCVAFGGGAGGTIANKGATTFKVTKATAEACVP